MSSPTEQIVEQAIAKQDAVDAGIVVDDDSKKPKDGDAAGKGDDDTKDKKTEDDKAAAGESGAGKGDEAAGGKKDDDKAEKFGVDDAVEVEEAPAKPVEQQRDPSGAIMSPAEGKYIADNIGEPIVLRGITGEGENVKEVEIKAYSLEDIPQDFKFTSDQQRMAAQRGFDKLEQKANSLLGEYRKNQSQDVQKDYETRENEGIKLDIDDLQKTGIEVDGKKFKFPMFSVRPGSTGFDESPEAKQMAEVLEIMTRKNDLYLQQYNQGRPYRHIGFAEAFEQWVRSNPDTAAGKKADEAQDKEDKERKRGGTERSQDNTGMLAYNIQKPTVKAGTSTRDILAHIDAMDD